MSDKSASTDPSAAELEVLKILWDKSELSAREVHNQVGDEREWSYSTTRTILKRMVDKGLVERRDSHGLAVFLPAARKVDMLGRLIRNFSVRVLEMGGALPASAFADSKLLSEEEYDELSRLLDEEDAS